MVATRKVKPNVKRAKALMKKAATKPRNMSSTDEYSAVLTSKCGQAVGNYSICSEFEVLASGLDISAAKLLAKYANTIHNNKSKGKVEVLETSDLILHSLQLPNPCPIKVEIGTDRLTLYIGPRDMVWTRYNGELIAAGTSVSPDLPSEQHEDTVEEVGYDSATASPDQVKENTNVKEERS